MCSSDLVVPDVVPSVDTVSTELPTADDVPIASDAACGEPGCACKDNNSCNTAFCIEVDGQGQCASLCSGGCPAGFKCTQFTGDGGDGASVCTPTAPRICEPCNADSDCSNVMGGSNNRCVAYKDAKGLLVGHFCSSACDDQNPCPTGYSCQDSVSLGGVAGKQCIKTDGVCGCDARATNLKLHGSASGWDSDFWELASWYKDA